MRKVELEDPNWMVTVVQVFFCDWLTNIECYLDWYGLSDTARVLFARKKLVGLAKSEWESVERET